MKKKKFFLYMIIILIIIISMYNNANTYTSFGWFHITVKNQTSNAYYIHGYPGNFELLDDEMSNALKEEREEIGIKIKDNYAFPLFFDEKEDPLEITISDIWPYIQENQDYFIRLKKNGLPFSLYRQYTIEQFYLY